MFTFAILEIVEFGPFFYLAIYTIGIGNVNSIDAIALLVNYLYGNCAKNAVFVKVLIFRIALGPEIIYFKIFIIVASVKMIGIFLLQRIAEIIVNAFS